jgi:hypothetical protein
MPSDYCKTERVAVNVTDNADGVFVTVDFIASDTTGETTLGYRLWASDEDGSVEVEIYDYQNDEVLDLNTFPELMLGAIKEKADA